eukprot:755315-Hanusia_phi.AAC.1
MFPVRRCLSLPLPDTLLTAIQDVDVEVSAFKVQLPPTSSPLCSPCPSSRCLIQFTFLSFPPPRLLLSSPRTG